MAQITLRIGDELARDLKRVAAEQGHSVNAFATTVLTAAVDPDSAGDDVERIRERLARAGLLAGGAGGERPADEDVAAAAREAAHGTPLSELVTEGRGA